MTNWKNLLSIEGIVGIIIGIIGLVWLINSIYRMWKIRSIESWPKMNATVINAFARPANAAAGNQYIEPDRLIVTTNSREEYIPIITYTYTINGRAYQSDSTIYSGERSYNSLDTKNMLGNIRPGTIISVYYNPSNPAESYVYNSTANYMSILISGLMTIAGIYLGKRALDNPHTVSVRETPSGSKTPVITQGTFKDTATDFNLTDVAKQDNRSNVPDAFRTIKRNKIY